MPAQQRQSRARNITETLLNHSRRRRSPSIDRLNNDRNRSQTPFFKQRPQSQDINNLDKNNILPSTCSKSHRPPPIPNPNHTLTDSTLPPKPKVPQPINQTPTSNVDGDTHPSVSTQLATTQNQTHPSNDVNPLDRQDRPNVSSHICAHCNAQFDDDLHLTKHEFKTGHFLNTRLNNIIECLAAYQRLITDYSTVDQTTNNIKPVSNHKDWTRY
jgi:hypothetical protein